MTRQIKSDEIVQCKLQNSIAIAVQEYLKDVEDKTWFRLNNMLKLEESGWIGIGLAIRFIPGKPEQSETCNLIIYPSIPDTTQIEIEERFKKKIKK